MNKVSIAIIIPGGIGTGKNNIGVPVLERIVKLLALDFQITVISLFKINENYKPENFELISISSSNGLLKILKFFWVFNRIHRQKRFQVVHGFWAMPSGFLAVVAGKIFKTKSVVSILGGDAIALPEIRYGQMQSPLYRKLILWTLRQAHEIISLTRYLTNNLRKYDFIRDDIKVIPWGIDTDLFAFQERPMSDQVQFLHIANLHPVKDQETLLRAFKIVSDKISAHLTIIGEGITENQLRILISALNLQSKITILGFVPYKDLPGYYHHADMLLHTSLSEGQSEVVTEAMSCGVLVCGTNVGLLYDLPECCLTVPVRNFEMLGSEVLKLLEVPQRMKEIRDNAHTWAKTHSIHWTVEKITELYNA